MAAGREALTSSGSPWRQRPKLTRQAPAPFGCERRPAQYNGRNLHVSTAVEPVISAADMVFLSVNTPTKARGIGAGQASDLRWIEAALR